MELRAFLGILQNARYLDTAWPIDIIETLPKNQLRKHSLFHLRVSEDDLVVVGYDTAAVGVLRDEVEVVVRGDHVRVDEGACSHVFAVLGEEALAGFGVDHDRLEGGAFLFVDLRGFGEEYVD